MEPANAGLQSQGFGPTLGAGQQRHWPKYNAFPKGAFTLREQKFTEVPATTRGACEEGT